MDTVVRGGDVPGAVRAGTARAARLAVLLLALLALAWPTLVAPGHHHPGPAIAPAGTAVAGSAFTPDLPAPDTSDACPLCQQVAHAGTLLLPTAVALPVPAAAGRAPVPATARMVFAASRRSHAWQSRAPPGRVRA